ncbi:SDR family NAD(P)-dependent oxidoreductase [Crocosphaera sp.]|uniref:SDR family NAD(P)-dependent oxidoreductase n=1 Tax=Crocosphaera sp. TaxID=2729996 RepID=UPI00258D049A|nr:SDR family NAD(P)-dependent oxidoreductase [Crocosphaera sp.]
MANHCRTQYQAEVQILCLDLTKSETLTNKAQQALNCHGTIDILVHGSGITQRSTAAETQLEVERKIMEAGPSGRQKAKIKRQK